MSPDMEINVSRYLSRCTQKSLRDIKKIWATAKLRGYCAFSAFVQCSLRTTHFHRTVGRFRRLPIRPAQQVRRGLLEEVLWSACKGRVVNKSSKLDGTSMKGPFVGHFQKRDWPMAGLQRGLLLQADTVGSCSAHTFREHFATLLDIL